MASSPHSPSPSSSTSSSQDGPPTLERLVTHFVAAKHSLSSTNLVWRANEIVNTAREALEDNAILNAKNDFVSQAIEEQLGALEAVRQGVDLVSEETHSDFKSTVATLDVASTRLNQTLSLLRNTSVEPTFLSSSSEPKYLFDFVDSSSISELHDSIRASIDRFNDARSGLADVSDNFDSEIQVIYNSLEDPFTNRDSDSRQLGLPTDNIDRLKSPVPLLFHGLEQCAREMATNLQSLVRHYDLCVTALKHTEGGGEAAQNAVKQSSSHLESEEIPTGLGVQLETLDDAAPPQPMSEEERAEMLAVVDRDAAEVDDVVTEIGEGLAEMEDQLHLVTDYVEKLHKQSKSLREALRLMEQCVKQAPEYISAANQFVAKWENEKVELANKIDELDGLKEFYDTFLSAYDGLIIEVSRRRSVRHRTEKVLKEAMAKIEKLYQEDLEEREAFKADQGEYLPSDIWPGLMNPPQKYEIRKLALDGDNAGYELDEIPEVRREAFERALQRQRARI